MWQLLSMCLATPQGINISNILTTKNQSPVKLSFFINYSLHKLFSENAFLIFRCVHKNILSYAWYILTEVFNSFFYRLLSLSAYPFSANCKFLAAIKFVEEFHICTSVAMELRWLAF